LALPVVALLAGLVLAPGAAPAEATILALNLGTQAVNVSVGFNTQVPLPDLSDATLAAAQKAGRRYVYRLGREECALLKAVLAKTCRLTNLSINTQIQQHNNAQLPQLYINGNASFTISLKDAARLKDADAAAGGSE
jgi:hypothetical protein